MIVLDTNVPSDSLRPKPADSVWRWLEAQPKASLFTTALSEAEIFYGLALLAAGRRRLELERATRAIFEEEFSGRVLPFDSAAARAYEEIAATRRRSGQPISEFHAQIAAIARSRRAAMATRNVNDFTNRKLKTINPWEE
jgi:toxin FitB